MQEYIQQTDSPEATEQLGMVLGRNLRGGEVIELISDLGGGKTTLTRGIAAGLASPDMVASPTFTISREYTGGRLRVYHFDLYRVADGPGVIADQIAEAVQDTSAVTIVEWANAVHDVLPENRLIITIRTGADEHDRELTVHYPEAMRYLLEGLGV